MRSLIGFIRFFFGLRGPTLVYLLALMLAASLLDVMSVGMFLPLFEGQDSNSQISRAVAQAFEWLGLPFSFLVLLAVMVLFFFLSGAFKVATECYVGRVSADLLVDIRRRFTERIFEADYLYFLQRDRGYFNNAMTVEFPKLVFAFRMFASVLNHIVFAVISLAAPLLLAPALTLASLAVVSPAVILVKRINARTQGYSNLTSKHSALLQAFMIQTLGHYKYLKSTQSQESILSKVARESEELGGLEFRQAVLQAVTAHGFAPLVILFIAALLFHQVHLLGRPMVEVGFVLYLLKRAFDQALGVQENYRKFLQSMGSINVYKTLDQELEVHCEKTRPQGARPDFSRPIRLEDVAFAYGDGPLVLKGLNLVIPPRATVALVGESGAGKSTLAALLTGVLKPTEGRILLGDQDYADLNQAELRQKIGYVTQEGVVFNDTITNNVTLWGDGQDQDRIKAALRRAHLEEFVASLPRGPETIMGDEGLRVSGGQRQRLNIARELFKDVSLLIFDEATSALDTGSEQKIQRSIEDLRGAKTTILIAHRLSTVKESDLIVVLDRGRIVEQGDFGQLYASGGLFRRMVDLQAADRGG